MTFENRRADWVEPTIDLHGGAPTPVEDIANQATGMPGFGDRRLLGRGGSALVYRVFDNVLRRYTALKVLPKDLDRERFLREARVMAQLEHPHIVPVHAYGVDSVGCAWINMALVEGRTLATWVRDLGDDRLQAENVVDGLDIIDKVCDAMAYDHSKGVLHLDIKPANVMVSDYGRVLLMDWGIAHVKDEPDPRFQDGRFYGTPGFVAPEQVLRRHDIDERTDVYALGGLLYHLLSGRSLRRGRSANASLRMASVGAVDPFDPAIASRIHPDLLELTNEALSPNPAGRPPSVGAFQRRLRSLRRGAWRLPTRAFAAGEVLVQAGDEGHEAYVIVSGEVEVRSPTGEVVRTLGPDEVFGELAVLSSRPRSMSVVATTATVVHVVTRADLEAQLSLASWSGTFVQTLVNRFAEVEASLSANVDA